MKTNISLEVTLEFPERLDKFLVKQFPQTSRAYWKEHLEKTVRVDGARARPSHILRGNERLTFWQPPPATAPRLQPNPKIEVKILYEDKDLIAVEKAPGLSCYPLHAEERNTLANGLAAKFPELMEFREKPLEAGLLHRLDEETSGVLLLARHEAARKVFEALAKRKEIRKYYLALVTGNLAGRGKIAFPIYHHPKNAKKMCVLKDPAHKVKKVQEATTEFRTLHSSPEVSCVLLTLRQGVRHQIRVHLAAIGHPILGDKLYFPQTQKENFKIDRQMLHARSVSFIHPISGQRCRIRADMPEDFKRVMEKLCLK